MRLQASAHKLVERNQARNACANNRYGGSLLLGCERSKWGKIVPHEGCIIDLKCINDSASASIQFCKRNRGPRKWSFFCCWAAHVDETAKRIIWWKRHLNILLSITNARSWYRVRSFGIGSAGFWQPQAIVLSPEVEKISSKIIILDCKRIRTRLERYN